MTRDLGDAALEDGVRVALYPHLLRTADRRKTRRMLLCPDDVAPCRRKGCGEGHCRRTGEVPLTTCLECGVVVSRHRVVAVCEECIGRYTPALEKGS